MGEWTGCRLTVGTGDACLEHHADPRGIFVELFEAGVACVCIPANLDKLSKQRGRICAIPLMISGATQLPCRLLAMEEAGK